MRFLGLALATLMALFIAPAAFAQIDPGDGIDNMTGLGDGCAGTMNPDQCMFGDSDATNGRRSAAKLLSVMFHESDAHSLLVRHAIGQHGFL